MGPRPACTREKGPAREEERAGPPKGWEVMQKRGSPSDCSRTAAESGRLVAIRECVCTFTPCAVSVVADFCKTSIHRFESGRRLHYPRSDWHRQVPEWPSGCSRTAAELCRDLPV